MMPRNEVPNFTCHRAADAQSLSPAWVVLFAGFRIDGMEDIVVVDEQSTDAAELIPLVQMIAFQSV